MANERVQVSTLFLDDNAHTYTPSQELLAQFRCDEISREVLVVFDEAIVPLEEKQAEGQIVTNRRYLEGLNCPFT